MYLRDYSVSMSHQELHSFGHPHAKPVLLGGEIEISAVIPWTPGSDDILSKLALGGSGIDIFKERTEYRCIYCGSVNPVGHRFCSQCGGPRGWIL